MDARNSPVIEYVPNITVSRKMPASVRPLAVSHDRDDPVIVAGPGTGELTRWRLQHERAGENARRRVDRYPVAA
jgi:hypothetical protein